MKKFLVLGNPIEHSKSPQLHNYWIKQHNIDAEYSKRLIIEKDIKETIKELRDDKISGANITIPFKNYIIPFVDELTETSKKVQSINTIYKIGKKIIGDNTDVTGFKKSLQHIIIIQKIKKL